MRWSEVDVGWTERWMNRCVEGGRRCGNLTTREDERSWRRVDECEGSPDRCKTPGMELREGDGRIPRLGSACRGGLAVSKLSPLQNKLGTLSTCVPQIL